MVLGFYATTKNKTLSTHWREFSRFRGNPSVWVGLDEVSTKTSILMLKNYSVQTLYNFLIVVPCKNKSIEYGCTNLRNSTENVHWNAVLIYLMA